MTLNRKTTVREIGRRTRLKNRDVQLVLEMLIEVWTEELVAGGRIEIENFVVIDAKTVERGKQYAVLNTGKVPPQYIQRVTVRASKRLKFLLNHSTK